MASVNTVETQTSKKFGTFEGVFTPTILTILGAIMYLRTGFVVGNAGIFGAIGIIVLANVITIATSLSIASVVTNIRVKAGGAFSIISQSLGLEIGGSISVPFYIAQAISIAFYIFAFSEGWLGIFPSHPEWLVVFGGFIVAFGIAYISANLVARTQVIILVVIFISLFSIFLGSFAIEIPGVDFAGSAGFTNRVRAEEYIGNFPSGNFWVIFAVFFPAVTGILAGVNMSGDLEDPRKSIPVGTLAAQVISMFIYIALCYWLSRVATTQELVDQDTLVVVERAFFAPAVLAGILAATFSSALTSLVGAPRVLQAIAQYNILPQGEFLSATTDDGEPRNALYITGVIALIALAYGLIGGGLDALAALLTMFFLITYTILNGVVVLEKILDLVSFRPSFRVPMIVSLIGFFGCIFAMFLIDPAFSLVAVIVIIGLYIYLSNQDLRAPWSDVRSGLFFTVAEWAAKRVGLTVQGDERAWKPKLLVPVTSTDQLIGSYRFLEALTYPRGSIRTLGLYQEDAKDQVDGLETLSDAFVRDGIFSQNSLIQVNDWTDGVSLSLDVLNNTFFRPNILFLPLGDGNSYDEDVLNAMADRATRNKIGVVLFKRHPTTNTGREQLINVWIRERSPSWSIDMRMGNFHLSLLMAYQIAKNWNGQINLITLVEDEAEKANGEEFLKQLVTLGRMPSNTRTIAKASDLRSYIADAPDADINLFGLQSSVNKAFMAEMVDTTQTSCLFVRDSGLESALA